MQASNSPSFPGDWGALSSSSPSAKTCRAESAQLWGAVCKMPCRSSPSSRRRYGMTASQLHDGRYRANRCLVLWPFVVHRPRRQFLSMNARLARRLRRPRQSPPCGAPSAGLISRLPSPARLRAFSACADQGRVKGMTVGLTGGRLPTTVKCGYLLDDLGSRRQGWDLGRRGFFATNCPPGLARFGGRSKNRDSPPPGQPHEGTSFHNHQN